MHLKPGAVAEYKRRHDEIWPELAGEGGKLEHRRLNLRFCTSSLAFGAALGILVATSFLLRIMAALSCKL